MMREVSWDPKKKTIVGLLVFNPLCVGPGGHIFFAQGDYYLPRQLLVEQALLWTWPAGEWWAQQLPSQTHTKRQATQHGCLPSLLGNGDRGIEIVCDEEKNILYRADYRAAKAKQKSLVPARQAQRPKPWRGPLSFVLFESHSPQFFQQPAGATHLQSLWLPSSALYQNSYRAPLQWLIWLENLYLSSFFCTFNCVA